MVSYGPWIQDPDIDGSPSRVTTKNRVGVGELTPYQDPRYVITGTDLADAFSSAQAAVNADANDPVGLTLTGVAITWGYELSFPNVRSSWMVEVNKHTTAFAPGVYDYNPPNYGVSPPEGAIGIDFENAPYDPEATYPFNLTGEGEQVALRMWAGTNFAGRWYDDDFSGDWSIVSAPQTSLHILVDGVSTVIIQLSNPTYDPAPDKVNDVLQNLGTDTMGNDIDLTPYVEGNNWTGELFLETGFFTPKADPAQEPVWSSADVSYGWGFQNGAGLIATWRPPRYRWVFPGDVPVPYRRIFPRDDSLAGGAARNWPPSKSVQAGNRTSGGYL